MGLPSRPSNVPRGWSWHSPHYFILLYRQKDWREMLTNPQLVTRESPLPIEKNSNLGFSLLSSLFKLYSFFDFERTYERMIRSAQMWESTPPFNLLLVSLSLYLWVLIAIVTIWYDDWSVQPKPLGSQDTWTIESINLFSIHLQRGVNSFVTTIK